jgi:hypothetical protein
MAALLVTVLIAIATIAGVAMVRRQEDPPQLGRAALVRLIGTGCLPSSWPSNWLLAPFGPCRASNRCALPSPTSGIRCTC